MKKLVKVARRSVFVFLFLLVIVEAYSQSAFPNKISYQISVDKLKSAASVDELIYDLPPGYEVVDFSIAISGKDIKYNEIASRENLFSDTIYNKDNFYKAAEPGNKVLIEFIRVRKKGSTSRPVSLPPREIVVTN